MEKRTEHFKWPISKAIAAASYPHIYNYVYTTAYKENNKKITAARPRGGY